MPNKKVTPQKNVCPVCETIFETGGRGRPKNSQVFCGKICSSYGRVKKDSVKTMVDTESAYLAGLIDGEGSIIAVKRNKKGRITWRLQVSSTTPILLDWCVEKTGVGKIIKRVSRNPLHADSQWWQCYSWNAKKILEQTLPYMVLKKDKAVKMIAELSAIEKYNHIEKAFA